MTHILDQTYTPYDHSVVCFCHLDGDDRSSVCFWRLHKLALGTTALTEFQYTEEIFYLKDF